MEHKFLYASEMTFLGIDIGFDRCGVSIITYDASNKRADVIFAGSILTDKQMSIGQRLGVLYEDLASIKAKYSPEFVSIEKLFFNRKNPTFEKVCMSKGIAMVLFKDCEILEVEPKTVKKVVAGNGGASKEDMRRVLQMILNKKLDHVYDDTIDAVCLALYHIEVKKLDTYGKYT